MEELEHILREHALRYRQMQPADAVKLIYQNEFGGGHIIRNAQACLDRLHEEYLSVAADPTVPLWESIGNGIVRVNLAALAPHRLDSLGQLFILSSQKHTGTVESFQGKLQTLSSLTAAGIFAFDTAQLDDYLRQYARDGFPPVSHSPQYREAFRPAYRIITVDCLKEL